MRARLLIPFVFLSACANGSSVLTVHLLDDSNHPIPPIDHVVVTAMDSFGHSGSATVPIGGKPLPQTFGLRFDASVKGTIQLAVEALAADGSSVAQGTGAGDVRPSKTSQADVQLTFVSAPPPNSTLVFLVQPSSAAAGGVIKPPVQVAIQDANGATVTSSNLPITLALGNNPGNAKLSGTLTVAAVGGIATFGDLEIDVDGVGYTLTASATNVAGATSAAFDIAKPAWVQTNDTIFGGTVTCFAIGTGAGQGTLYLGTEESGMFKSTNSGASWTSINNGLTTPRIKSCAVDAADVNLVYAGADTGVFRSTDGGTSWTRVFAQGILKFYDNYDRTGYQLIADPTIAKKVYVAYGKGVASSSDGGSKWDDEDSAGFATAGGANGRVRGIALGLTTPRTIWLAVFIGGVFSHASGAAGWTKFMVGSFFNYMDSIAVNPTDPTHVVVGSDGDGVYYSHNSGGMWTKYSTASPVYFPTYVTAPRFIQFSNDGKVIDILQSSTTVGQGLARSTDSGATWNSGSFGGTTAYGFAIDPNDATGNHAWVGVQAGAFKATNGTSFVPSNAGLTAFPILSLAVAPSMTQRVYAGTRNAGLMTTANGGTDWAPANGAGGSTLAVGDQNINVIVVHPTDPSTVLAAASATPNVGVNALNVIKTSDGGSSGWSMLSGGDGSSLAMASDPMLLYSGTSKSINGGASWASSNLPASGSVVQLVIDAGNSSTVYAIDRTSFHKTVNGGAAWSSALAGLPTANATFTSLAADATANVLYLGGYTTSTDTPPVVTGHVYRSSDGGDNWTEVSAGLPPVPVLCLAAHPTRTGVVYAGTQGGGIVMTQDGGTTWTAYNAGLGDVFVNAIAFDRSNPTILYAGTAGAGVYKTAP